MDDHQKSREELIEEIRTLRRRLVVAENRSASLSASEERYRSVVDTVIDGVITVDDQGTIESFNPAAERIFGYRSAEVVGRNVSLLMPEPFAGRHREYMARYLETGEAHIIGIGREVEGLHRNRAVFPIELSVSQFRLGDRVMYTGIVRDITARKQLEAQLLQAQKMESIGQLAGGIAHDFNNQLGIILFDVDLLLAGSDHHPELRDDLLKIRKVVLRGANLARQLLLFSRRQQMEPRSIDLNHHVQELRKMLGRLLGERIVVELHLAEDLAATSADASNIDQVILNLALNSRDAMPEGGTLTFATRNLVVDEEYRRRYSQARPGRFVCLEVGDTGCGMSEEVRLRIFEPFYTTKEEGKGTGLGLSVVYGIVQAHGGWIEVESRPGYGSRFLVHLPALERVRPERGPSEPVARAGQRGSGERILLLEDDPELRERTARALTEHGYAVTTTGTVAEANARFMEAEGGYALVLSDVLLPDGRGTELVFELLGAQPGLAALLVTGFIDEHPDWERVRRGRLPVLQKPFAVAELLDQVRRALAAR
ncbi:MAG: PAS domain S-box protein [Candidatus Latescibacterota bacterium]|jgi:PAS domain S-box-containing protein